MHALGYKGITLNPNTLKTRMPALLSFTKKLLPRPPARPRGPNITSHCHRQAPACGRGCGHCCKASADALNRATPHPRPPDASESRPMTASRMAERGRAMCEPVHNRLAHCKVLPAPQMPHVLTGQSPSRQILSLQHSPSPPASSAATARGTISPPTPYAHGTPCKL